MSAHPPDPKTAQLGSTGFGRVPPGPPIPSVFEVENKKGGYSLLRGVRHRSAWLAPFPIYPHPPLQAKGCPGPAHRINGQFLKIIFVPFLSHLTNRWYTVFFWRGGSLAPLPFFFPSHPTLKSSLSVFHSVPGFGHGVTPHAQWRPRWVPHHCHHSLLLNLCQCPPPPSGPHFSCNP